MSARRLVAANAGRLAAGAVAVALYAMARATTGYPALADTAVRFEAHPISAAAVPGERHVRPVNPRYEHIRGWISAVGAAVAIDDLDGDGRPNDLCLVDPRDDSVAVLPAPGTGRRYDRFELETPSEGYDVSTIAPMGCLPGDFNEDGKVDLLVYYWGRPPFIFTGGAAGMSAAGYRPVPLVAAREAWYTNAALQADVDGDGRVDLLFGNYFPEDAQVLDTRAQGGGTMQTSMSRAFNGGRNRLFLRDPATGTPAGFKDHSSALSDRMATGWTLALAAADLTGDLLPEIYIANDFGPDRMLVNLSTPGAPLFKLAVGRRDFMTPRSRTLGRDSFKGMGAEFADLDGDGALDLAVSNIAQEYGLLESHFLFINTNRPDRLLAGIAPFVDRSGPRGMARNGWGWDIKAADFDNDGRPELFQALGFLSGRVDRWPELQELATANDGLVASPGAWAAFSGDADLSGHERNRLYALDDDGVYRDIGIAAGLDARGVSRGIAIADIDLDGRLDAAVARQWSGSSLLRNRAETVGAYLSLDLRLSTRNGGSRAAIGAVARIERTGALPLIGTVDGGNGHSGKRAPFIHFGLGDSRAAVPVSIRWRDADGIHHARLRLRPGHHRLLLGRTTGP